MNLVDFQRTLHEYYSYRDACRMKESPRKNMDCFFSFSCRRHPGENNLTQAMIDEWWEKRVSENASSYCIRVCQVLPYLRYVTNRYPDAGYTIPRTPKWVKSKYSPHSYTDQELNAFFHACDHMGRPNNSIECRLNEIEFPVLFRLLFSTGMRTTEARMLTTENVDLHKGVIYVSKDATKGYTERKVVLHESMLKLLTLYDKSVDTMLAGRKIFFPNNEDGIHDSRWLSSHFRRLWKKAGNPDGVVAYDLRHHFIIENINSWTDSGIDLHSKMVALCKYVGHTKLSSTYGYYSLVPRLGEIIEQVSTEELDDLVLDIPCI